jgi:hypothetical protein
VFFENPIGNRLATDETQIERGYGRVAGPEAGVPTEGWQKVENVAFEGRWWRVLVKNGCAQLHVFTRIYTILHNVFFR